MVPFSGLPAAMRSARDSRPWSAELRTMWVSGSLMRSSTWRSSSVSAPCISSSMSLPSSADKIAHDARQLLPGVADRLHARLHHAFLQLGGDVGEPLQRHLELGIVVPAHDVEQLIARQHQLRHHRHQVFERVEVDADRLVARSWPRRAPRPRSRPWPGFGLGSRGAWRPSRLRRRRPRRFAEHALQLVERDFARAQRPLQNLGHQRSDGLRDGRVRRRCPSAPSPRARRSDRRRRPSGSRSFLSSSARMSLMRSMVESTSVTASPVTGMLPSRNLPIRVSAACASVLQARQAEEAAGAFDGVDQPEDVAEDLGVVGLLLEAHQLDVDRVETFVGLGQKFPQQVVHETAFARRSPRHRAARSGRSVCCGSV